MNSKPINTVLSTIDTRGSSNDEQFENQSASSTVDESQELNLNKDNLTFGGEYHVEC